MNQNSDEGLNRYPDTACRVSSRQDRKEIDQAFFHHHRKKKHIAQKSIIFISSLLMAHALGDDA
jgi:hypothetical protein